MHSNAQETTGMQQHTVTLKQFSITYILVRKYKISSVFIGVAGVIYISYIIFI